jgi:DNA-binding NarL/FixJ family response regulator
MMKKGKPLSPREMEVLQLLWQGFTTRDIAKKLDLSFNTIAMHRQHIRAKLGVTSMTAALNMTVADGRLRSPLAHPIPDDTSA